MYLQIFLSLILCSSAYKFKSKYFKRTYENKHIVTDKPFNTIATEMPNSLYYLDDINNLKKDSPKQYSLWNNEFLYVLDNTFTINPYCPHMGANLIDGKCTKTGIICPFHTRHISYNEALSKNNVEILNDQLYVNVNSPPIEKEMLQDVYKFLNENDFKYVGEAESIIECSITELAENAIDTEHFSSVHGKLVGGLVDIKYKNYNIGHVDDNTNQEVKNTGFSQKYYKLIDILTKRKNVSYSGFNILGNNKFTKFVLNVLGKGNVFSVQFMPGLNVQFDETSVILFHSVPLSQQSTKLVTQIYKPKNMSPILGILESFLYAKFLEPDMKILSKKQLLEKENNVSPFVLNWRKQYNENFM